MLADGASDPVEMEDAMDYDEFDDMGTGFEEACERAYDAMVDTATALLIEEAAEAEELWGASMENEIAKLLKK